jgi:hypothetical protein
MSDLIAGQVQVMFSNLPAVEYIKAGKLRALAVTTATRSDELPDVATIGEFVPGYEASAWYGLGTPKGTPAGIVDRLNKETNAAGRSDDQGAACRIRRRDSSGLARRLREPHRRGNREVGQGGEVCGPQTGVIHALMHRPYRGYGLF